MPGVKNSVSQKVTDKRKGLEEVDILVRNACLITMDTSRHVFTCGAVAIKAGVIVAVGRDREITTAYRATKTIDAHGAIVHPGFIDNHIHLCLHNMRWAHPEIIKNKLASPGRKSYWDVCVDEVELAGSRLASLEMARNGTTCFLEAGTLMTPDLGAAAVEETGVRALLGDPFVFNIEKYGPPIERIPFDPERAFKVLGTELKRNSRPGSLVRGHVNLRGMASATDELELAAKAMADEYGVVFNQHQSYNVEDTANDDKLRGRHPLLHFNEIGALGKNCSFAHMNFIRDDEVGPVIRSGMSVIWCPAASMLWGIGGTFNGKHAELYKQGANVVLGSDSANWSTAFDIGDQMLLALLTARDKTKRIDMLSAEDVLTMATINGARGVGLEDRLGSLEAGKWADLVVRHEHLPEAQPGIDSIRSMVHSSRSKSIDTVIVNGRIIVEKGHSTCIDEEEVYARSRETTRRIMKEWDMPPLEPRWPHIE